MGRFLSAMGAFIFPMVTRTAVTLYWLPVAVSIWRWEVVGTVFGLSISNINGGLIFRSARCGRTGPAQGLPFISTNLTWEWIASGFATVDIFGICRLFIGRCGDSDERVSASVVKKPLVVKVDQTFGEGGSCGVLSGLLIRHDWFQYRVFCLFEEMGGILDVEESFAGCIYVGA